MHPLRPVRTELPSLCRTIGRCCLPKVTKNLLLLLRSASLTTAHLHHLAPRSMLKGLLTLRLDDCTSSHLKLTASPMFAQLRCVYCILPEFPQILQISSTATCAIPLLQLGGEERVYNNTLRKRYNWNNVCCRRPRIRGSIF